MNKIITIANNKGGVLKTTLATNIAGVLVKNGKRALIVDADPQGNITSSFGNNAEDYKVTLTEVILDNKNIGEAIKNVFHNLDILPTNSALNYFGPLVYAGKIKYEDNETVLQNVLQSVIKKYDYIIIDSAPYMDLITINAIKASDLILIPTQMEIFAAKGLVKLLNDLKEIGGQVKAIIPTLFDARTTLHTQMLEQVEKIAQENKIQLTKTKITKSIQAANALTYERLPLVLTKSKSKQVKQYHDIVKELELI